jgi:type IV secretory pathway TrbD component
VYLDIPEATAWFAAGFGLVIAVVGVLLALPYGRADRRAEPEAPVSADLMS